MSLEAITEPLSRLKWGILPVRREVEDYPDTDIEDDEDDVEYEGSRDIKHFEYRDEANRPWWKFFDEYEYRINKSVRSKHKWYKWFNESDTPAERKLILKLDIILTLYSCMAYWVKYLDQTNLNNAYISGMKEELNFKGNDLVNTQAMYTVGSIVFQIPFMYILYRLPMSYVLPFLDIGWSVFTIGCYRVNTVPQLKVLRFFIGVFEAPAYLAYQFLFGSFYKYDEIVRRSCFYYIGQYLGVLTAGLLSASIYETMDGYGGLSGWRWMMIVEGLISVAVGVIGIYSLPGTPQNCYSIWLTDDEIRLARKRMKKARVGTTDLSKKFFDKQIWKKIATSWQVYVLSIWNIFCWNNNNGTSGAYLLWLKSLGKYSIPKANKLGTISPALGILWLILTALYADLFHARWQAIVFTQVFNFIGNVILAVWYVPDSAKWFAFMLQYFGWAMAPVLYSWINDICRHDIQMRAIILIIANMMAQTFSAWISVLVWKTVESPRFLKGFTWTATAAFCLSLWTLVVLYFYKREERSHAKDNGIVLFNSKTGENYPLDKESLAESAPSGKEQVNVEARETDSDKEHRS